MSWKFAMLDIEGHAPLADPPLPSGDLEAMFLQQQDPAPARSITPRRPLRLSPQREDAALDPRQSLVALNIFSDVFGPEPVAEADQTLDPRIRASRHRARARLSHAVNTLAPDEANFWHVSAPTAEPSLPQDHPSATIAANDLPDLPAPLHEHLARVRAALYADSVGSDAVTTPASAQLRLASHAMNATLVVVAFPVGAALTTYSLLRGGNMRLSAQAMAVVAGVLGIWQSSLSHLL
ncbi:hypothetical protein [Paragemmobacter straminiformis]|uniref:Uncharacterized protein n=1 Tax=Paragemmobacter straminiformis TaxID=2045119 RepID=A0A842I8B5_9RHOB|nr:hypothetical protein [Gemmobacter straminiformis]MBC2835875.1 hypothetical protein [Gemmobacter straminiformis]